MALGDDATTAWLHRPRTNPRGPARLAADGVNHDTLDELCAVGVAIVVAGGREEGFEAWATAAAAAGANVIVLTSPRCLRSGAEDVPPRILANGSTSPVPQAEWLLARLRRLGFQAGAHELVAAAVTDAPPPAPPPDRGEERISCFQKRRYGIEKDVRIAVARIYQERGVRLRGYACEVCGGYHLTKRLDAAEYQR